MAGMTEREGSDSWTLTLNAVSIAIVAVLAVQVFHESCHTIATVLVGARLEWVNFLFGIQYTPVEGMNRWGDIIISGNPAVMNILTGMIAVAPFSRRWVMRRPTPRLFFFYFGAYSLLTGFGNLIINAVLYQPGGKPLGDWEVVLAVLDGGFAARIAMILVGAAGELWVYSWLVRSTLRFGEEVAERHQRAKLAWPLLMEPYLDDKRGFPDSLDLESAWLQWLPYHCVAVFARVHRLLRGLLRCGLLDKSQNSTTRCYTAFR